MFTKDWHTYTCRRSRKGHAGLHVDTPLQNLLEAYLSSSLQFGFLFYIGKRYVALEICIVYSTCDGRSVVLIIQSLPLAAPRIQVGSLARLRFTLQQLSRNIRMSVPAITDA